MNIKLIIEKLSDKIFNELNDEETLSIINSKIFNPIINNIFLQLYPYIILLSIIIISLFILLVSVLIINIKDKII